jgi:hypothetical protein
MTKLKKTWMALAVGALLLCTLAGVVWARPHERPQAQDITRKVTLTGGDFVRAKEGDKGFNDGTYLRCDIGECYFVAPVVFPCLPSVTVERIKLHVRDNNGTRAASAMLYRSNPPSGSAVLLGTVASPPGVVGHLQTYTSDPIDEVVWPSQKAILWITIGGQSISVYGVTVEYHRNI